MRDQRVKFEMNQRSPAAPQIQTQCKRGEEQRRKKENENEKEKGRERGERVSVPERLDQPSWLAVDLMYLYLIENQKYII